MLVEISAVALVHTIPRSFIVGVPWWKGICYVQQTIKKVYKLEKFKCNKKDLGLLSMETRKA